MIEQIKDAYDNGNYVEVFYKDAWKHERRFYGRIYELSPDHFRMNDNHGQVCTIYYNTIQSIHS